MPSQAVREALLDEAVAAHEAGRLDQADALYRQILQDDPDDLDALNLRGLLLQDRGNLADSMALLSRAVELAPDFAEALTNLARVQCAAGALESAVANAQRAVALEPELAEAHLQLGRALLMLLDDVAAASACRRAAALAPESADAQLVLAVALARCGDHRGAATAYREVLALAPGNADAAASLASALRQDRDIAGSAEACEHALALAPQRVELWELQGANMAALGRFDAAERCFTQALRIDPDRADAIIGRAVIHRLVAGDREVAQLRRWLDEPARDLADRISAGFALGSLHDRAGDYGAAFADYALANRLAHEAFAAAGRGFDLTALHRRLNWLIDTFDAGTLAGMAGFGDPSELPVFVVGMPRSGTSLVEQIAASHPAVFGAGERKDVPSIVDVLDEGSTRRPSDWDWAAVLEAATGQIGRLRTLGGPSARVIDKLPDNVMLLGHIAALFPHARVVICRRDLRDTALSCFFQQFSDGVPWAYDLADCAARAAEIERLTCHWLDVLPLPVLEMRYEDLVADPEGQSRRLIEFLGLAWDPACLLFHATERPVLTASGWQVRQPIFGHSVGRWRHYRQHLGPLLEGLAGLVPSEGTAPECDTPDQVVRAARAHRAARRDGAAEAAYRSVLRDHPDWPEALGGLGQLLVERRNPCRGLPLLLRATELSPADPGLLVLLGRAQRSLGNSQAATQAAEKAVALAPQQADAQLLLGLLRLDQDEAVGAAEALRRAVAQDRSSFPALLHLAIACIRLEDFAAAADALTAALALRPGDIEVLSKLGFALSQLGLHDDALDRHRDAIALAPADPRTHHGLVLALLRAGDPVAAIEACRRAIGVDPGRAEIWGMLGNAEAVLGHFAEAAAHYRHALAIDPDWHGAKLGLAQLQVVTGDPSEIGLLRTALHDPDKPVRERTDAGFALGAILERNEDHDAAFVAFAAANRLRRGAGPAARVPFDVAALRRVFRPEALGACSAWGDPSDVPVFVVGLPRSGTSLVEQIAASHPAVFGAGERKDIHRLVGVLERGKAYRAPDEWDPAVVRREASRHIARLRDLAGSARRVIDKMPDNVQFLGHISVMFPGARIIICRRDLRDVCLSCFFQHFADGLEWTNDLADLAARVRETERLIALWRDVLPLPMLELQYEALVGDLEGQSRKLIDFLGLEWDPACLAFHRTERAVMTASHWQVRQPIYTSSVGRWRHYRDHLGPLLDGLAGFVPQGD